MYNRTPYNRTRYNRATAVVFEWIATAAANSAAIAAVKIVRAFDGTAEAVTVARGVLTKAIFLSGAAAAETDSGGIFVRTVFFAALAEAVTSATGAGVSTYGTVTIVLEGVNMNAGDELIIDTERMTVTLNGESIIDRISDESAFFKLKPGANDIIVEGGTAADVKVLWKDRWL